jgi:uncharacterized protein (DUF934 family)
MLAASTALPLLARDTPPADAAREDPMTDAPTPSVRLWTPQGFREDEWRHAEDGDALAGNGRFILPLAVVAALDPERRRSARERLGAVVMPGEQLDLILPFLDDLALVALAFPAFNDGRSFSKAELLRSRHGYVGAVRAIGQVLPDQFPHMLRLGFDEFEVSHPVLIERLERGETGGIAQQYQPTAKPSAGGEKYSWRRTRPS